MLHAESKIHIWQPQDKYTGESTCSEIIRDRFTSELIIIPGDIDPVPTEMAARQIWLQRKIAATPGLIELRKRLRKNKQLWGFEIRTA